MKLIKEIIDKKEVYFEELSEKDKYGNLIKTFKSKTKLTLKNGKKYDFNIEVPQTENQEIIFITDYEGNNTSLLTDEFKKDFIENYENRWSIKKQITICSPFLIVSISSFILGLIQKNIENVAFSLFYISLLLFIFLIFIIIRDENKIKKQDKEIKYISSLIEKNNEDSLKIKNKVPVS